MGDDIRCSGNIKKGVNAYVESDSVMHFYPSTSITQKIQPYAKGANIAAKAFTVVTTGFDIAYT